MGYNKAKTFAVARLREAARDCKVRKTLLELKHTASRTKVDQLALACAARPAAYAAAKERAQKAYEDFLKAAGQRAGGATKGHERPSHSDTSCQSIHTEVWEKYKFAVPETQRPFSCGEQVGPAAPQRGPKVPQEATSS